MAANWKEIKGSRRMEDHDPNYIDYIISFVQVASTAEADKPVGGDLLVDVQSTRAAALPSTGLDAEPSAVQVSLIKYVTGTKANVTVRFRGFYTS